jgi:hypothetical protein
MDGTSGCPPHTTPSPNRTSEWVTISHPHHPLRGQRVEIVRVRRGIEPDLIVRLPDGLHAALAVDWTDYLIPDAAALSPPAPHLLAVDGLRQLVQLVAQVRHEEPGAAAARPAL